MDTITYRDLPMSIVRSLDWQREPILDDSHSTYLHTRWRGSFIVTYNPGAVSFITGNPPAARTGQMPASTDVAIRRFLEQPRGRLIVTSNGVNVIVSPQNSYGTVAVCDARNGPILRVNSITQIQGNRLWQIHLELETWIDERPLLPQGQANPLVSNRWSVHSDTNWQHLTTRVYQGTVTARADLLRLDAVMQANGRVTGQLDSLRLAFAAFSVPAGFQRTDVKVHVYPDGNTADYWVTDTEQLWNKSANCPAVRIEVQDASWIHRGSATRAIIAALQDLGNLNRAAQALLPKAYRRCNVRAWGNQRRSRLHLTNLAMGIAATRIFDLGPAPAVVDVSTTEIVVAQDTNNYVDVSLVRSWDLAALGVSGALGVGIWRRVNGQIPDPSIDAFRTGILQSPNTTATDPGMGTPNVTFSQDVIGPNPAFSSRGTRGTWLGPLVTQVLEGFNALPADVP